MIIELSIVCSYYSSHSIMHCNAWVRLLNELNASLLWFDPISPCVFSSTKTHHSHSNNEAFSQPDRHSSIDRPCNKIDYFISEYKCTFLNGANIHTLGPINRIAKVIDVNEHYILWYADIDLSVEHSNFWNCDFLCGRSNAIYTSAICTVIFTANILGQHCVVVADKTWNRRIIQSTVDNKPSRAYAFIN